jgi:hypothetical protein
LVTNVKDKSQRLEAVGKASEAEAMRAAEAAAAEA